MSVGGDVGVDPRHTLRPTADPPADEPCQHHGALLRSGADQGAAPVTRAGVLPLLPPRTQPAGVEAEPVAQAGPPQRRLAVLGGHGGHIDLLELGLQFPPGLEGVLAPARDPAPEPGGGKLPGRRQTDRRDLGQAGPVHRAGQSHQGQVVVERPGEESLVQEDVLGQHVLVKERLQLGVDVPVAQPDHELLRVVGLDAVGGRHYVAAVYKGSAADVLSAAA